MLGKYMTKWEKILCKPFQPLEELQSKVMFYLWNYMCVVGGDIKSARL